MITLTEEAAGKVKDLLSDKDPGLGLRLFVKPGGCSGFSYGLALDNPKTSDEVLIQHGINVLVDPNSKPYLQGAEIDYVDSLNGQGFTIVNPQAVSTCGCGSSFHTKDDSGSRGSCS